MRSWLLLAPLGLLFVNAAVAGPTCTKEDDRSQWLPAAQMLERATHEVPKLKLFKVTDGNCYEIYGWDAAGKKVEIYYHPVSGEIVKRGSW